MTFELETATLSINPKKGLAMIYTSGTTGSPKGVLYSRQSATVGFETNIKA